MKLLRYFRVALESIFAHKMRAFLTMLGIIIGVCAVLITMGIGRGASADITSRIASQGTTLLTITPGASSAGGVRQSSGSAGTLTLGDAEALQDRSLHPDVVMVAPTYTGSAQLVAGDVNSQNQVVGATQDYVTVRNLDMAVGRFLSAEEVESLGHVVVLGYTVASDLFAGVDPLGQTVRINNEPFQVVGVLEESGGGFGFGSSDNQAFVPLGVAQGRLFNASRYRGDYTVTTIYAQAPTEERVDAAEREIEQTLRLRHQLTADEENDFQIISPTSLLDTISSVTDTLTIFLGSIGGISLVVGGIGIMNIMLVSVTERTREIGLRRALGAHDSDILWQFLVEALVLTVLGGLIGVGLSYGFASLASRIPGFSFNVVIGVDTLILALAVSAGSGFVFGLYPAMRATQLDPIEALRFE